jgi:hypothetical protein
MSMPQPISVALIGSTADIVRRAKKHFRLGVPGIGAAYLASLQTEPTDDIPALTQIPAAQITLWIALDAKSFSAAQLRHRADMQNPRYGRGFYNEHFPEPCILVDFNQSPKESKNQLSELAQRIINAWYATS